MINRPDYIAAIEPFIDKPLIKILAGIRRCGKSTIFEMLREELLRRGIGEDQIVCKRYTEMDIPENITAKQMYDELTTAMAGKGHCYLLLDEIQEITGWEKAVNSLLESADADIYVTGSNSKLMSSEISTYLTGHSCLYAVVQGISGLQGRQHFIPQGTAGGVYPLRRFSDHRTQRVR